MVKRAMIAGTTAVMTCSGGHAFAIVFTAVIALSAMVPTPARETAVAERGMAVSSWGMPPTLRRGRIPSVRMSGRPCSWRLRRPGGSAARLELPLRHVLSPRLRAPRPAYSWEDLGQCTDRYVSVRVGRAASRLDGGLSGVNAAPSHKDAARAPQGEGADGEDCRLGFAVRTPDVCIVQVAVAVAVGSAERLDSLPPGVSDAGGRGEVARFSAAVLRGARRREGCSGFLHVRFSAEN